MIHSELSEHAESYEESYLTNGDGHVWQICTADIMDIHVNCCRRWFYKNTIKNVNTLGQNIVDLVFSRPFGRF